jgi:hypothetical protein
MVNSGRLCAIVDIDHVGGHCFTAPIPDDAPSGDDLNLENCSTMRIFEEGTELGPAHSLHDDIVARGSGRFSHWGRSLMFSSSDGSDPRTNRRSYQMAYRLNIDPLSNVLAAALNVDFNELGAEQRYAWGERIFSAFAPGVKLSEFGRSMFGDAEFLTDYERFDPGNYRSFDRKFARRELLKLALPLDGDIAECGVFRGASAYLLAKGIVASARDKRLHLFDLFAGLSMPKAGFDGDHWHAGDLACGLIEVASNLREYASRILFHPGWIPEKFPQVADKRFCFVHIDVDLYQPTRDALAFFGPRIVSGGLIVCDDYGFETCPGARRAMEDYAGESGHTVVHLPTGQGIIFAGR